MKIIVGLGNPGEKYKKSRHNAGWIFLDEITSNSTWQESKKFKAEIYENGSYLFVKPLTYMNLSGESVRKILDYYGLLPKKMGIFTKKEQDLSDVLIVIHDEIDLDFGKIKISTNSSSAGHKGVESIIKNLKTKNFTRIRLGIKNDKLRKQIPPEKFVMQNFSPEEYEQLKNVASNYDIKNPA